MSKKTMDSRLISSIIIIILGILLYIKFTGNNSIFSYQGISEKSKGFSLYQSGISTINTFLGVPSEQKDTILTQGKNILYEAYTQLKDKHMIDITSGEILKLHTIEFYQETKECVETLISGYNTLQNIHEQYTNLSSGLTTTQELIATKIHILPESNTKQCLYLYASSLQHSLGSVSMLYKNIQGLQSDYTLGLISYKQEGGGICPGSNTILSQLEQLSKSLSGVIHTNSIVQEKLNSSDIQEYNKLCNYGSIQGLTGLQEQSRKVKNAFAVFQASLHPTEDVISYVKELIKSSSGNVVNINTSKK